MNCWRLRPQPPSSRPGAAPACGIVSRHQRMLRILDRYVIRSVIPPFLMALLVFTFMLILPFLMDLAETLISKGVPASHRPLAHAHPGAAGAGRHHPDGPPRRPPGGPRPPVERPRMGRPPGLRRRHRRDRSGRWSRWAPSPRASRSTSTSGPCPTRTRPPGRSRYNVVAQLRRGRGQAAGLLRPLPEPRAVRAGRARPAAASGGTCSWPTRRDPHNPVVYLADSGHMVLDRASGPSNSCSRTARSTRARPTPPRTTAWRSSDSWC